MNSQADPVLSREIDATRYWSAVNRPDDGVLEQPVALLPAILRISLARGAKTMTRHGVIVKRRNAIVNPGGLDVFCADKTDILAQGYRVPALALPCLPVGRVFDVVPLPGPVLAVTPGMTGLYPAVSGLTRCFFCRRIGATRLS